jgi:hypothetical protein
VGQNRCIVGLGTDIQEGGTDEGVDQLSHSVLPAEFEPPAGFENPEFRVRPISVADAEKDYEAVMESVDIIHTALLDDKWPTESFTLAQNRRDLKAKERKFERRDSFTYTVVTPDESRVLGCVYLYEGIGGPDAAVFLWVRSSEQEGGLDARLEAEVRDWVARDWPFEWVVYPGRGAPWRKVE